MGWLEPSTVEAALGQVDGQLFSAVDLCCVVLVHLLMHACRDMSLTSQPSSSALVSSYTTVSLCFYHFVCPLFLQFRAVLISVWPTTTKGGGWICMCC